MINEEDLSVSVQKYTVLYDKGHKEFHRKDIKKNAWKAVAEELGFENGKNILSQSIPYSKYIYIIIIYIIYIIQVAGDEAEKAFTRLRDKYARAKKLAREGNKSGSSARATKKAREKLENLAFMQWLDNYIKPRKSKNNDEILSEVSEDEDDIDDSVSPIHSAVQDAQSDESDSELQTPSSSRLAVSKKNKMISSQSKKRERSERATKPSKIEQEEMAVLRSVVAAAEVDNHRDDFDVFGELVARKMRKLSRVIDEDAMEIVEHSINMVLMNAKGNHARNGK